MLLNYCARYAVELVPGHLIGFRLVCCLANFLSVICNADNFVSVEFLRQPG